MVLGWVRSTLPPLATQPPCCQVSSQLGFGNIQKLSPEWLRNQGCFLFFSTEITPREHSLEHPGFWEHFSEHSQGHFCPDGCFLGPTASWCSDRKLHSGLSGSGGLGPPIMPYPIIASSNLISVFTCRAPIVLYPQTDPVAPLLPRTNGGYRRSSCPLKGIVIYPCITAIVTPVAIWRDTSVLGCQFQPSRITSRDAFADSTLHNEGKQSQ